MTGQDHLLPPPQANPSSLSMATTTATFTDPYANTTHNKRDSSNTNMDEKAEAGSITFPRDSPRISGDAEQEKGTDASSVVRGEDNEPSAADNEEHQYPGPLALGLITVALCLAVFLVALDQTIIATAIPKITDQFKALDDVGWYGSAYMLTLCSFQLVYGKIYTFFSLKWTFLAAIGIFEVGSVICGIAPNSETLIIGRAIAGLGCAGIFSGALIILAHSVPLRQRPMYTGMIGAMYGIASVAGPLMGGAFTDNISWRWCFYINLPIGAITVAVIIIFFKPPVRDKVNNLTAKEKFKEFDFIGTALLLPGIICLLLALQWGGSKYEWKSPTIIALICTFAVLIIGFIFIQFHAQEKATLPPRIIGQRSITFGSVVSLSVGSAFMLLVFYIPIWFQAIKGVSATKSGIMNLPFILGLTVLSVLAGIGITLIGYYVPFMLVGGALFAVGCGLLTTFNIDTPSAQWIGYQFLAGAGVGMVLQQPLIAAQTVLKLDDIPTGTAAVVFFQSLGGALFISVGQNVFNNELIKGIRQILPDITPMQLLSVGATSLKTSSLFKPSQLPDVLNAYNDALTKAYYVAVAMALLGFFASFGMEWASVKGKKVEAVAGA